MKNQSHNKDFTARQGWISIIGNTVLFVIKYWAGIVSGSVSIIADAWHTLSDSITSIIVLISGAIRKKPADKEHPFGHGRIDLIASIIIGVLLAVVGFSMLDQSIEKLTNREPTHFGLIAIIVTAGSIIAKELMAQYAFFTYRKTNNPSLKADGWHHRSDAISSVIVLMGVLLGRYFWWIDGVVGILVALMLFGVTYQILQSNIQPLIGECPSEDDRKRIANVCREVVGKDVSPHHFHKHRYGNHTEITFHVYFDADMTIHAAHSYASIIEQRIEDEMNMTATIHAEDPTDSVRDELADEKC